MITEEVARRMRLDWRQRCRAAADATPPGTRLLGFIWAPPGSQGMLYPADPDGPTVGSISSTIPVYALERALNVGQSSGP